MRIRSIGIATATVIVGALALSSPAFAGQPSDAPSGDWDSSVSMEARTGEVLEQIDMDQWDSVVVVDAQTGRILPQSPAPAIELDDSPSPAYLGFFS